MEEIEKCHNDLIKHKNEIVTKLLTIKQNKDIPTFYRNWLSQTIKFINEECDVKL